jgi:inhibitor of Bruton tyrosine kinase
MFPVLGASPQNFSEIMAQQTSEQAALSAKAVPRSLKDIQEEEAFLQWWEAESARVQEEEEVAKTTEASLRGGQRGRGRGRGRGHNDASGRGRGRGDFRGRAERGTVDGVRGRFVNQNASRGHAHNGGI